MTHSVKFEYYPKLSRDIIENDIKFINMNRSNWPDPFFNDVDSYLDLKKIKNDSEKILNGNIKNVIVLGTGGSIQTILAIKHLSKKKIYPITSSRSVELRECLDYTNPEDSIVIPISRSGETLDVNSTIGTFLNKGYSFLGISSRGTMNNILKKIKAPIFEVPDLSGRFAGSMTNVGIVPAYISGIKIENFLNGLKSGYEDYLNYTRNDGIELAIFLFNLYKKGYKIVFSMPYSKNLEGAVGLLVQEISESTGKEGKGLMGAHQEAPLCQHSVLEYLLGGTKGAVVPIIFTIDNEQPDMILNSEIDYVNGKSAQTVVNYQADATFQALLEQEVPAAKITIDSPTEKNIGALISFIQSTVYYLCLLLNVNWANNPKVNIGKEICNEILQKETSNQARIDKRNEISKAKFENFW